MGNSFGGALTLWMAAQRPDLCDRLVLMGPGGWPTRVNENLEALWGYKPSVENMKRIMDIMAFDRALVTDELAELRYRATIRPGAQERFERIFPPPHQRWLDAQALSMRRFNRSITSAHYSWSGRPRGRSAVFLASASASEAVSVALHRSLRSLDSDRAPRSLPDIGAKLS